jgi:hypothetical protein
MSAKNNSNPTAPNGQATPNGSYISTNDPLAVAALIEAGLTGPGNCRTILEFGPPRLTLQQALFIAKKACQHLLTGQPEACTFELVDLELAIPILEQMASTIQPAR